MFLVSKGKSLSLTSICSEYWEKLNKTKSSGAHHDNALKKKITKALRNETDEKLFFFYALLAKNKWALLKELVVAKPDRLLQLSQEMDKRTLAGKIPAFWETVNGKVKATSHGTKVMDIFNYSGLRGSYVFTWLSHTLDLPICPYCNFENTISIKKEVLNKSGKKILVDQHLFTYNHFMIKSMYPYLSASFWNLVPSCHNCNSNLKGDDTFVPGTDVHPYVDDVSKISAFTLGGIPTVGTRSFNLRFIPKNAVQSEIDQVRRFDKVFQIEQRYKHFQSDMFYLNTERMYYDDSSKENLLNSGFTALRFADMKEVVRHIAERVRIPLDNSDALRQTKGKLMMDLAYELGITTYKGTAP